LLDEASEHVFAAPHLFAAEIRNALLMLEWRGRLSSAVVDAALANLAAYGIAREPPPDEADYAEILALARRERLTVYDAVYLWHAIHGDFTLASRDADLLAAAARNVVAVRDLRV
jgi:predicted nucleic acid-binding protein